MRCVDDRLWGVVAAVSVCGVLFGASARGQGDRVEVEIAVTQTTSLGQSVFVSGPAPEFGGDDVGSSVKLEPSSYPTWRARFSLPAGTTFIYWVYVRNDAPGQWGNDFNGTRIGGPRFITTPAPAEPSPDPVVFFETDMAAPMLRYETDDGRSGSVAMGDVAEGASGLTRRVAALVPERLWRGISFWIEDAVSGGREPAAGTLRLGRERVFVRDGEVFGYVPAHAPLSGPRKEYDPASPPVINSAVLGEARRYRVVLPRGYDDHPGKRYPVVYFHDGQNVFDQGSFGTWNADETADWMIRAGEMREVIMVGVDNTANRAFDYLAPDDGYDADDYTAFMVNELKPVIDAQYRTLTGAADTATVGSSFGGVVSLYQGFDFADVFGKVGAFSTASWAVPIWESRLRTDPSPAGWRVYLDSGDAGTANDGFSDTIEIRDGLLSKAVNPSVLYGDLLHVLGVGQIHNEAAWASRLPGCYRFLFPVREEVEAGGGETLASWSTDAVCIADVDGDGAATMLDVIVRLRQHDAGDPQGDAAVPAGVFDGADVRALVERVVAGCGV